LISLHLGSGASAAAVQNGKSIDTTMGLTPLEGLPGATRSRSIDPSLVFRYTSDASSLARSSTKELHISVAEDILNKQAGWYSMVGTTDFGKVVQGMHDGDERIKLVFDMFVDRVVGYVGNYFVKLGGQVDALTFSGGIGEKSGDLRKAVVGKVGCLGFKLDDTFGGANGNKAVTGLGPNVLLIKTNKEVCAMVQIRKRGTSLFSYCAYPSLFYLIFDGSPPFGPLKIDGFGPTLYNDNIMTSNRRKPRISQDN